MFVSVKSPKASVMLSGPGAKKIFKALERLYGAEEVKPGKKHAEECRETPGTRLAELRSACSLTQTELSALSGVRQVMISDYETGHRKLTRKAAVKLGKALGIAPKKFFPKHFKKKE